MTPAGEQLCYSDAYARTVEARVVAVESGDTHLVVLDRTVFYPGGGGQPSDRGVLLLRSADGRTWTVRGARKSAGEIVHELEPGDGDPPAVGDVAPGRPRLGPPADADADAHRPPRPVRRRVARLRRPGHGRQHGAGHRPDGLRVRADVGRPGRRHRGDRQRRAGGGARRPGQRPAAGRGVRDPGPHPDEDQPAARGDRARSGRSRSSGSTSRRTAARTSRTPARSAASA